jgi:hypothetical protein
VSGVVARERWYHNGWVVGTGTAVISVFVLKVLDWIFGLRTLGSIVDWILREMSSKAPGWLVLASSVASLVVGYATARFRTRARAGSRRVRIVPMPFGCHWSDAKKGGEPAMMLNFAAYATNASEQPVRIPRAYVVKPRSDASVLVKALDRNMYGDYAIPPGATTDIVAHIGVHPPVTGPDKVATVDIVVVDNYEDEHRIRRVTFHPPPPKKSKPIVPVEALHAIVDPVEKQVASVLKAEAARYARVGRGQGGIGSVYTIRDARSIAGVPSDSWTHGSHENSYIVSEPAAAEIKSENVEALVALYTRLSTPQERNAFVRALTSRLRRNSEYAPVGYLIMLALQQIGNLGEALTTAKINLRGDGEGEYNFDELLRVLAAVLSYQHHVFTDAELDEIERFAEGIGEYAYEIPARLAAVRAYRVRKS